MAYVTNPGYGFVPGAPQRTNWWSGPGGTQFNMSDLLQSLPPALPVPPPPPPPPPMAATVTPQDVALQQLTLSGGRGAEPGGGGPGTGAGGIGNAPQPGMPNPGMGGGIGTPGGDRTFSGYPGVYAQSPNELNSQFSTGLGIAGGIAPGVPGLGTVAGALGGAIDAARYNGINAQYGIPGTVNPWGSAGAAALASIGIPFTNWDLAHLVGVPTAYERQQSLLDAFGRENIRDPAYGALQANAQVGPATVGEAAGSRYPAGFALNEVQLAMPGVIAANPDVFASGVTKGGAFDAGGWAEALAGKGGPGEGGAGTPGDAGGKGADPRGGDASGTSREGGDKFYRGGLVGAPPGRYAAGGAVRAGARLPTYRDPNPPGGFAPRTEWSDLHGVPNVRYGDEPQPQLRAGEDPADAADRGPPPVPPHEQNWRDFMYEMQRAQERDMYPEQLARGGVVDANITPAQFGLLRGIDPPGPDDQIGALQTGEGVITKKSMGKGWAGLLAPINAGKLDPAKVKGLLAAKPRPRR